MIARLWSEMDYDLNEAIEHDQIQFPTEDEPVNDADEQPDDEEEDED